MRFCHGVGGREYNKTLMRRKKWNIQILFIVLFSFWITACGKQADTETLTGKMEEAAEEKSESDAAAEEAAEEDSEADVVIEEEAAGPADEQEAEQPGNDNVITAYVTENVEYSDDVMPVQYVDDLSLLENMKYADDTYAYRDGKVYYRRYHEDSYEEAALWGSYDPIPETEKEIVCLDADGVETVLFTDKGYGDIYLINDRLYMTDSRICEENGSTYTEKHLYSVDMQGNDRIDYGNGKIFAVDREREIVILEMAEEAGICYYTMNCETGERKLILAEQEGDHRNYPGIYQDGRLYYEEHIWDDSWVFKLCAVSLEGERREIIAFTSTLNQNYNSYMESILNIKVDGDRIYFIVGGYDGSAVEFRGGKLISMNLDGTDYKAVETRGDTYYISHDNGKTLVHFPRFHMPVADYGEECDTMVWDVEADRCCLSELPQKILLAYEQQKSLAWRYYPSEKGALCELSLYDNEIEEKEADIYAVPDASGRIVRAAANLGDSIKRYETEEADMIKYKDLYYADGFLYFTVEYSIYNAEAAIGWRDGYRRLRSDVYRLKTGESAARPLYSY